VRQQARHQRRPHGAREHVRQRGGALTVNFTIKRFVLSF
jgi:hypothetical protein